jgi:phosphoribosylformylglycinamidine synthase
VLSDFLAATEEGLTQILNEYGLAMDLDDLKFMQSYFRDTEKRDPTETS